MSDGEPPPAAGQVVGHTVPNWEEVAKRLGTTEVEQYRELAYRSQYRLKKDGDRKTIALRLDPEVVEALDALAERVWEELDKKALSRFEAMHVSGMSRTATIRWILYRWLMLGDQW